MYVIVSSAGIYIADVNNKQKCVDVAYKGIVKHNIIMAKTQNLHLRISILEVCLQAGL